MVVHLKLIKSVLRAEVEFEFYFCVLDKGYIIRPIETFDNIQVFFRENNFEHAFYESRNRRKKDKSKFSYKRANRIYWIKWVLENPNAELYKGYNHKSKTYEDNRRLALCVDNYVVVIEFRENRNKAKFITAYVADGINGHGQKAIDLIKGGERW